MEPSAMLTAMRKGCDLTQAELARRSGIPRTAINAYERGHRVPTATTLLRLTEACGLRLIPNPRPSLDLHRNAEALEQALDLAELLPTRRRKDRLEFPSLLPDATNPDKGRAAS
jgi:transcriptional regulator with XRE-family HTH domain